MADIQTLLAHAHTQEDLSLFINIQTVNSLKYNLTVPIITTPSGSISLNTL